MNRRLPSRFLIVLATVAWGLVLGGAPLAQEPPPRDPKAVTTEESSLQLPGLTVLVGENSDLSVRLADLEGDRRGMFDATEAEALAAEQWERIERYIARLSRFEGTTTYDNDRLRTMREEIDRQAFFLRRAVSNLMSRSLSWVDTQQRFWSLEKARWLERKKLAEGAAANEMLAPIITSALQSTDQALSLLMKRAAPVLAAQFEFARLNARLQSLKGKTESLMGSALSEVGQRSGPPLLSREFFSLFDGDVWGTLKEGASELVWPGSRYFTARLWEMVLKLAVALGIGLGLRAGRELLEKSERWRPVASRPWAAGIFVGLTVFNPVFGPRPDGLLILTHTLAGVAAARIITGFVSTTRYRRLVYLVVLAPVLSKTFLMVGAPAVIQRLFVLGVAVGGLALCGAYWKSRHLDQALPWWGRLVWGGAAATLTTILVANLLGYGIFASYLVDSSLESAYYGLVLWLLALLARGGVELALGPHSPLHRSKIVRRTGSAIQRRAGYWVDVVCAVTALGMALAAFGIVTVPQHALTELLELGFNLGQQRISLGLVLGATLAMYGAFVASWLVQAVLTDQVYAKRGIARGVRIAMNRLVHYGVVLVGFLFAVSILGVDFQNLTILAGAFGIGIGFGLQNIVNNFISGIILLFERPVKVGDVVQIGASGTWGKIREIGMRATVVETFEHSEIIVPNGQLISTEVTNWTLSEPVSRVTVNVGIAYGSDVPQAMKIMREVADVEPLVLKEPPPAVLFMEFGESALNFELRVWIGDINNRPQVRSALHQALNRRFREARVEIPFPQRDLHLRSVPETLAQNGAATVPATGRPPD